LVTETRRKKTAGLRNKRILITAGPTWVALDRVRVISNTATGQTGILLARKFRESGAQVTLVAGPVGPFFLGKHVRIIHFRFFDELKDVLFKKIRPGDFDIIIHSAAVSDYRPLQVAGNKIPSGQTRMHMTFIPTEKIIDAIKRKAPEALLVGFKFEPGISRRALIHEGEELMKRSGANLVVANTVIKERYQAYVLTTQKRGVSGPYASKRAMCDGLVQALEVSICKE
jgi:phosphopantothenoylcysteine decarboxylase/phosphopantothenate--cysteine ligase